MEFLLLNFSVLVVFFISSASFDLQPGKEILLTSCLPLLLLFNVGWAATIVINVAPDSYLGSRIGRRLRILLLNSFILAGLIHTIDDIVAIEGFNSTALLLSIVLFAALDMIFLKLWYDFYSRQKSLANARALILVGGQKSNQLPELTQAVQHQGYQVVGWLNGDHRHFASPEFQVGGLVEDLPQVLISHPVDEIFICLSSLNEESVKYAVEVADYHGVRVNLVPEMPGFLSRQNHPSAFEHLPVFQLRRSPLDDFNNYLVKKVFDFVFALLVLAFLLPMFIVIGMLIYLDRKGPIFYAPVRKGEKGASFKCYKFRTMSVCDDPDYGEKSTEKDDPRITKIGRWLRKYDLDELPQFFNVLKGDMSIVGPRPHRVFLHNDFRKIINEYMVRHYVKPGITGWAQVNGWRGPTKTLEQKKERIKHDLWYIENWSFWLDVKIIFMTVFSKKTRKNAF